MISIFNKNEKETLINRINQLNESSTAQWGTMDVAQMLAHCNIAFELTYEDKHPIPSKFKQFILKLLVKQMVVGEKPYAKNGRTAPVFVVADAKDFEKEKARLVNYINKTNELGTNYFEGKNSHSFGKLTSQEWNTMFVKHLDHHLKQFGV